MHEGNQRFSKA